MSMGRVSSNGVEERIGQLCSEFKLPTVGAEAGPRFTAAGHMDALHTLVEVLEQEAEDRRQRRIIRIRRASRLPVGKTWDTFVSPLGTSPKPVYPRVCGGTPLHTEQVQWLSVAESAWEVVMGMREVSCLPALGEKVGRGPGLRRSRVAHRHGRF